MRKKNDREREVKEVMKRKEKKWKYLGRESKGRSQEK